MFSNSAGFRVDGGNFYNVSGDVNLENHRHLTIREDGLQTRPALQGSASEALHEGWVEGPSQPGVARAQRRTLSTARAPNDTGSHPLAGNSSDIEVHNHVGNSSELTEFRQDHPASFRSGSPTGHPVPELQFFAEDLPSPEPHPPHLSDFRGAMPSILGGTFISAQNVHHDRRDPGMAILHRAVALEALYNSAENFPPPRCHPETRTKILDDLFSWATDEAFGTRSILWLYGPAGAGKSAIMQTLSRRLQDAGRLGGSFFFKRGHRTRGNAQVLFATLAYQLAIHNRRLRSLISKTVEDDPSVVARRMDDQFHELITRPCQLLNDNPPHLLLIDGLDECEHQSAQLEILRVVVNAARSHSQRFKVLIASRRESYIREEFERPSYHGLYFSVNVEQSFNDVWKYLHDEFSRIHHEHPTMRAVPRPWPSSQVMYELVQRSSGHFIYAATVIRFIDDRDFRPTRRLETILIPTPESDSPFEPLDQLYTQILSAIPTRSRARLLDVLCCIMHIKFLSLHDMEQLLRLEPGDFELTLHRLHSLVYLPSECDRRQRPRMHHASFQDFLEDPIRSRDFHIGRRQHMNLARRMLEALSHTWKPRDPWIVSLDYCYASFKYITSHIQPSNAESLVPLFRTVNSDFVLSEQAFALIFLPKVVAWLKEIQPVPETAVQLWVDYEFLHFVTSLIQYKLLGSPILKLKISPGLMRECRQILADAPQTVSLFQMWWLANETLTLQPGWYSTLDAYQICLLSGISWDDMRVAICSLQAFVGTNENKLSALFSIATVLPGMRKRWKDLAQGCIQVINLAKRSEIRPMQHWIGGMCFGRILRSSPTCPTLLPALRNISCNLSFNERSACLVVAPDLELYPCELHHIVQWLKLFQEPPLDLIELWNGYLETSRRLEDTRKWSSYSDSDLDAPWIQWTEWWKRKLASLREPYKVEDEDDGDDALIEWDGGDSQELLIPPP